MFGGALVEPVMNTKQAPPRSQSPEVELNEKIQVAAPDPASERSVISGN